MELAVEVRHLKKSYAERPAVAGVTFEINKQECFGLLGPNGAGKTTLLKMLSGLTSPTEGELFILGLAMASSLREIKARIGVVPQGDSLDLELTVHENLKIFGQYLGLKKVESTDRIYQLLKQVSLDERTEQVVETLSGGYRRRLAIIRALLNEPELLILDEPTVALDPQARAWTWDFLRKLKNQGCTLVLTTHYMEEAEALCDRVALMNHGVILDLGTPEDLILKYWGTQVLELQILNQNLSYYSDRLREKNLRFHVFGEQVVIRIDAGIDPVEILKNFEGLSFSIRKPNLNDVFLKLTGGHDLASSEVQI